MNGPPDDNHFLERLEGILCSQNWDRLDYLMGTLEFKFARFKLSVMKEKLQKCEELSPQEIEYLHNVEYHQQFIHPHIETLTVNGETREVLFTTRQGGVMS